MKGRRIRTVEDIERLVSKGVGQGEGADYQPWLRVRDVPSQGRSKIFHGLKTSRAHQLLSDLEYHFLLAMEFSENIVDIREQYPLLPIERPLVIADRLNIRYPTYVGTDTPYVMTTDFLLTVKNTDGSETYCARSLKGGGKN